jgi:uncharacterized protein YjbJ (UPF0337 family)
MNEDRVVGSATNLGGKAQEGLGRASGDVRTQAKGVINQAAGTAQDLYGQAKESVSDAYGQVKESMSDATEVVRQRATDVEDYIRYTIEKRPYTTAVVALCLGWLIGRMGRRDS